MTGRNQHHRDESLAMLLRESVVQLMRCFEYNYPCTCVLHSVGRDLFTKLAESNGLTVTLFLFFMLYRAPDASKTNVGTN